MRFGCEYVARMYRPLITGAPRHLNYDPFVKARIDRPRILVEPNAHHLLNLGDVAMLQVAVERLAVLWPDASIRVITENPARLARLCPAALPLDATGRRLWFEDHSLTYTLHRLLPRPLSRRLLEIERSLRRRSPRSAERLVRARAALRRESTRPLDEFLAAVADADIILSTGAGALTDHFAPLAIAVLDLLEAGKRGGAVTALLGHGIGPITDRRLLQRASAVLPTVDLITIRERLVGAPLLESAGVDPRRIATTGDDAIELAYRASRNAAPGRRLGLNLRVARYAHVDPRAAEAVGAVVREAAERHAAEPLAIPISYHPMEGDAEVIAALLRTPGEDGGDAETPLAVIERIQQCRLVVTGSYHAAVFALAQGIPAVGLTQSAYYDAKFRGLSDQFGGVLPVISLDERDLRSNLGRAIDEAWQSADEVRPQLLELAARQVEQGRAAYRRLYDIVAAGGEQP
jgi:polysaccharide pyruvyl transferase WcaK-like protein